MTPEEHEARTAVLRRETLENYRAMKIGHPTILWERAAIKALEDLWLNDAYEAEAAGNVFKYNYCMGWARRAESLFRGN